MSLRDALVPEFDREAAATRRTLERIPERMFGWKPHEKSTTMGSLGIHLARVPSWTVPTLRLESFDLAPPGGAPPPPTPSTTAEILALFDGHVADAREAIRSTDDAAMMKPWTLLTGGKAVFTMPRVVVLRSFIMNHMVHHRAQLGVYLRLNNIPVPAIYGPSADEQGM
jgi:uncharacterized damage-inducible protein DinB